MSNWISKNTAAVEFAEEVTLCEVREAEWMASVRLQSYPYN